VVPLLLDCNVSPAHAQLDDELMQRVFEAWRELRRGAVRKLNSHFYGTGDDALDPGQMDTLDVIASRPRWRMSRLARALYLDPSTVTRSVDRLTEYGLVTRVPAADDARGVQVRATPSGRALCETVSERRRVVMRSILADLPRAECEHLAEALERLVTGVATYALRLESGDNGEAPLTASLTRTLK
jgi:DNA-binding MarR family transcriptional regulator